MLADSKIFKSIKILIKVNLVTFNRRLVNVNLLSFNFFVNKRTHSNKYRLDMLDRRMKMRLYYFLEPYQDKNIQKGLREEDTFLGLPQSQNFTYRVGDC